MMSVTSYAMPCGKKPMAIERPLLWRAVRGRGAGRQLRREAAQRLATGAATADAKSGITPIWANMVLIMA